MTIEQHQKLVLHMMDLGICWVEAAHSFDEGDLETFALRMQEVRNLVNELDPELPNVLHEIERKLKDGGPRWIEAAHAFGLEDHNL